MCECRRYLEFVAYAHVYHFNVNYYIFFIKARCKDCCVASSKINNFADFLRISITLKITYIFDWHLHFVAL